MPPVPSSCAAIIRSARPGPRSTRTSPSATISTTKAAVHNRNSAMAPPRNQRPGTGRSSAASCSTTGCRDVEAVVLDHVVSLVGRHRAGHQAGDQLEGIARRAARQIDRTVDETRRSGMPRRERAARDVDRRPPATATGNAAAAQQTPDTHAAAGRRQQAQADPGRRRAGRARRRPDRPASRSARRHPDAEVQQRRAPAPRDGTHWTTLRARARGERLLHRPGVSCRRAPPARTRRPTCIAPAGRNSRAWRGSATSRTERSPSAATAPPSRR